MWEIGFWGSKGNLNEEALGGAPYPNEPGCSHVLTDMPSCRHHFMYAQEATRLPLLLETVAEGS